MVAVKCGIVFIGWVISYAHELENYSNYFGEGAEISWIWATAHSLGFLTGLLHGVTRSRTD